MQPSHRQPDIEILVSTGRYNSYLRAAGDDHGRAVALYEWNVELSAACFEAFHYVEIIVRNAVDREMKAHAREGARGIPWFLLPQGGKTQSRFEESIETVRRRLRNQHRDRETRDQIIAGVDFGFWTALLHSENEELWRHALHKAFPHSSGKRKDVVAPLEKLRLFRNKLAHHDSLLAVDVRHMLDEMKRVLAWIDPAAEQWLARREHVSAVHSKRPITPKDTVVVAARDAWALYQQINAYVCQAGRTFQSVEHLAFYADREIKPEVPAIRRRLDDMDWAEAEADRLTTAAEADDRWLAEVIRRSRAAGWTEGRYQVFELTAPGDADHMTLPAPVPHTISGRGSAYTQRQRYTTRDRLTRATSTLDL